MKLDFDFSLYKGTTRLKSWWREVKKHFTEVQTAHNALEDTVAAESKKLSTEITNRANADTALSNRINSEASARSSADTALGVRITSEENARAEADSTLQQNINTEAENRRSADNTLQQNINSEALARQSADNVLQQKINVEATARENADNALDVRVKAVEDKAHTHTNKTVLDSISADDIDKWNGIKQQVTQAQLEAAVAAEAAERLAADNKEAEVRAVADKALQSNIDAETSDRMAADNDNKAVIEAIKVYFEDLCFGFSDEFGRIYEAVGITVYDGGIFGMLQDGIALDGGDFTDEVTGTVDCGGFEPITINTAETVIDGGAFDTIATTTIDGGTY